MFTKMRLLRCGGQRSIGKNRTTFFGGRGRLGLSYILGAPMAPLARKKEPVIHWTKKMHVGRVRIEARYILVEISWGRQADESGILV